MLSRCYNSNDKDYKNYGAIGITVDPLDGIHLKTI